MKASLIITTYNWNEALSLVLASVARQTRLPDEVIIADDGSRDSTRELLQCIARDFPVPLRHSWQPDEGFRAARSRNRAIAAARGDYIVMLDGDMVLHPHFIADHLAHATPGGYVQGSRVLTSPDFRQRMLADPSMRPGLFTPGIARRRHTLRWPRLARWYLKLAQRRHTEPHAIKTCNQGWWRADLLRLNGFDERMVGWGREDEELAWRAHHAGLACRQLRFCALAFHLHHTERHQDGTSTNDGYLAETRSARSVRCALGIDQHIADLKMHPLADLRDAAGAGDLPGRHPAVTAFRNPRG
ncbi:MAG TPA: glycosyltransferase family 2 protein [Lysobacter sp.]|nr:glycosyltransferase family 2 protein [Lysobacter sp.]